MPEDVKGLYAGTYRIVLWTTRGTTATVFENATGYNFGSNGLSVTVGRTQSIFPYPNLVSVQVTPD